MLNLIHQSKTKINKQHKWKKSVDHVVFEYPNLKDTHNWLLLKMNFLFLITVGLFPNRWLTARMSDFRRKKRMNKVNIYIYTPTFQCQLCLNVSCIFSSLLWGWGTSSQTQQILPLLERPRDPPVIGNHRTWLLFFTSMNLWEVMNECYLMPYGLWLYTYNKCRRCGWKMFGWTRRNQDFVAENIYVWFVWSCFFLCYRLSEK